MANYDLTYEGSRVQGILDTGNSLKDAGYIFRGEATPSTVPGTPTERVAYIGGPGTYTNFGGSITVGAGCICVFKYTGSAWSNQVINTGVLNSILQNGPAFDLSAYNAQGGVLATYADLSAALTALNALPADFKKGGMSMKYVQTSDNKYVQYRLMSGSFNTTVANWQGVTDIVDYENKDLENSGGVFNAITEVKGYGIFSRRGYINNSNNWAGTSGYSHYIVSLGTKKGIRITASLNNTKYCFLKTYTGITSGPDFATGSSLTTLIARNSVIISENDIPNDANYMYLAKDEGSTVDRTPSFVSIGGVSVLDFNIIDALNDLEIKIDNEISDTNERVEDVYDDVKLFQPKDINNALDYNSSVWSNGTGVLFNIEGYDKVFLKAKSDYNCYYAFLTSDDLTQNPQFAGEETKSSTVLQNSEVTVSIPSDAKYLCVTKTVGGTNRTPVSVLIDNVDAYKVLNKLAVETKDELKGLKDEINTIVYNKLNVSPNKALWIGSTDPTIGTDTFNETECIKTYANTSILKTRVIANDKLTIYTKCIAGTIRAAVLVDNNNVYRYITAHKSGSSSYNYLESPLIITSEYDGYLYVCCNNTDINNFEVRIERQGNLVYIQNDIVRLDNKTEYLQEQIDDISSVPDIMIPSNLYAVVGKQFNLYYDYIAAGIDNGLTSPVLYTIEVSCDVGYSWQRYFQYTPVIGDVGTHNFTVNVFDSKNKKIASKTVNLNVVAASAPSGTVNILQIGDSTCPQKVTETLYNDFDGIGFNPTFRGTMNVAPYKSQGMGGRSFATFANYGSYSYYTFYVENIGTAPVIGTSYTNNGSTFKVVEINISERTGYINTNKTSGSNDPETSGNLVGNGRTIPYTRYEVTASNPLWNGGQDGGLDIANYRVNKCGMASDEYFDLVGIRLGCNDCISNTAFSNVTSILNNAKKIVDAFIADSANTKILIELPTMDGNTLGGWASNYESTKSKNAYQNNIRLLIKGLIAMFDNNVYDNNVYVVSTGSQIDRYYGYGRDTKQVADRITENETVHINAIHPINAGYEQLADADMASYLAFL